MEVIKTVLENARSQITASRDEELRKLKQKYRDSDAAPDNAELDQKTEAFIDNLRAQNEAEKASNIAKADQKAAEEIAKEYKKVDAFFADLLGGK